MSHLHRWQASYKQPPEVAPNGISSDLADACVIRLVSSLPMLVFDEDRGIVREMAAAALNGEKPPPRELRIGTKTGGIRQVFGVARPNGYRGPPAVMGYYLDLSGGGLKNP